MKYFIYHIPGKKIGVTCDLNNRVTKQQGYKPDEYEVLEILAKKRGCISRGGVPDFNKISEIIVDEFRRSLIGRISLDTPKQP